MSTQSQNAFVLPPDLNLTDSISHIKSQGVRFVRLVWVDYSNLVRYRILPIDHLALSATGKDFITDTESPSFERISDSGTSLVRAALALGPYDNLPPSVAIAGDFDLKPDLSTLWRAPFAPTHAYAMGRFFEKPYSGGGESENCPRTILQKVLRRAESDFGAKFLVGFETEFIVLDRDNKPIRTGAWSTSQKLQCGPAADCIHDIAQSIIDAGIHLDMYHAENAGGQYEVVTGPLPPLQAADALIATREIIYNVARKHGFRATLCPKLYTNQAGTGCHAHISVKSPRSDTPSNHPDLPSLPSDLASLMAGILNHFASICMFTLPVDTSYSRVVDGAWSGGTWVCWGRENKEAPLRLCGSGDGFNVEIKAFDGIANPYLALAAILGAGLTGIASGQVLEMRNCLLAASNLTTEQRQEMHITTKMPTQSVLFEGGLDERMRYISGWLPSEAWKIYKAVREDERAALLKLKEIHPNMSLKELSANACLEHY